jgi:hypothetical protein
MAHKKWRGFAVFSLPKGETEALMTVCPGNPDQEGTRFRAIMEAAGALLNRLYIIEAGGLGFHNLKRFITSNEARILARYRGRCWQESHTPYIKKYMGKRAKIIPMDDIASDPSYRHRASMIREIYNRGNNSVTEWFNYSAQLDVPSRTQRNEKKGVIIEPWAIKANSIDYLCEEYTMRSVMWKNFRLKEIYVGLAVTKADFFQRENILKQNIDLTIPEVCPITLTGVEMQHDKKLGTAFMNSILPVPRYATLVHSAVKGPKIK